MGLFTGIFWHDRGVGAARGGSNRGRGLPSFTGQPFESERLSLENSSSYDHDLVNFDKIIKKD